MLARLEIQKNVRCREETIELKCTYPRDLLSVLLRKKKKKRVIDTTILFFFRNLSWGEKVHHLLLTCFLGKVPPLFQSVRFEPIK